MSNLVRNEHPEFQAEDHTYRHMATGRQVPSGTTILKVMGTYKDIDPETLSYAAMRGTYVHKACELYDMDDLDIERLDPPSPVMSTVGSSSGSELAF
jgi:hypothetical protein